MSSGNVRLDYSNGGFADISWLGGNSKADQTKNKRLNDIQVSKPAEKERWESPVGPRDHNIVHLQGLREGVQIIEEIPAADLKLSMGLAPKPHDIVTSSYKVAETVKEITWGWTIFKGVMALLLVGGVAAAYSTGHISLDHKWGLITGAIIVGTAVVGVIAYKIVKAISERRAEKARQEGIENDRRMAKEAEVELERKVRYKERLAELYLRRPEPYVTTSREATEWRESIAGLHMLLGKPEIVVYSEEQLSFYQRNKGAIKKVAMVVLAALIAGALYYGFHETNLATTITEFGKHTWKQISDWFNGPFMDFFKGPVANFFLNIRDKLAPIFIGQWKEITAVVVTGAALALGGVAIRDGLSIRAKNKLNNLASDAMEAFKKRTQKEDVVESSAVTGEREKRMENASKEDSEEFRMRLDTLSDRNYDKYRPRNDDVVEDVEPSGKRPHVISEPEKTDVTSDDELVMPGAKPAEKSGFDFI